MSTRIDDIVDNYENFLDNEYPAHIKKRFCNRLASHPAGARAEVITFHFFRSNVDDVRIEEASGVGGADFRCSRKESEFIAEVTSLDAESVARKSGIENRIPENCSVRSFQWITQKIEATASKKTSQLSGYSCPRILVMTSEHCDAQDLISSKIPAEFLLTGETQIPIPHPFANPEPGLHLETHLQGSVFLQANEEEEKIEPCRQSISAILLCSVFENAMKVIGILHPDPVHKFPIKFLPSIPFVRLKKWPPENNKIGTEWVTHEQTNNATVKAFRFSYE